MEVYYLLSWNDEYQSQCILAGPDTKEKMQIALRKNTIERLMEMHGMEQKDASDLYKWAGRLDGKRDDLYELRRKEDESIIYFGEFEEHLSIVAYV